MRRKVKKWLKSYPSAGRLVKMDVRTFSFFLHGGGRRVEKWRNGSKSVPEGVG